MAPAGVRIGQGVVEPKRGVELCEGPSRAALAEEHLAAHDARGGVAGAEPGGPAERRERPLVAAQHPVRHPEAELGLEAAGELGRGRPKVARRQGGLREGHAHEAAVDQGPGAAAQPDGGVECGERLLVAAQVVQGPAAPAVGRGALGVQPGRLVVRRQGLFGVFERQRPVAPLERAFGCPRRRAAGAARGSAHAVGPGGRDLCRAERAGFCGARPPPLLRPGTAGFRPSLQGPLARPPATAPAPGAGRIDGRAAAAAAAEAASGVEGSGREKGRPAWASPATRRAHRMDRSGGGGGGAPGTAAREHRGAAGAASGRAFRGTEGEGAEGEKSAAFLRRRLGRAYTRPEASPVRAAVAPSTHSSSGCSL